MDLYAARVSAGATDAEAETEPEAAVVGRRAAKLPLELLAACRRDPQRFPEHVVLIAQDHFATSSYEWAQQIRGDEVAVDTDAIVTHLCDEARRFARIDGALAGTPFLIALVPAYVSVLWQQVRTVMRIGALAGADPRTEAFAAEILFLRGLYATSEEAADGLAALRERTEAPASRETASPPAETGRVRRFLTVWIGLAYRVLILAGFVSAPARGPRPDRTARYTIRQVLSLAGAGAVYAVTFIVPLTFMFLMAWSCENDTRRLTARTRERYGFDGTSARAPGRWRAGTTSLGGLLATGVRRGIIVLSVLIPLAVVALAIVDHGRHVRFDVIAAWVGLILVLGLGGYAARH